MVALPSRAKLSTDDLIRLIETQTGRPGRRVGRETQLLCPHHEGPNSHPSLNVREGDGGYPVIKCRSRGCTTEQIIGAVGLSWADIFGDDSEHWTPSGPWVECYDYVLATNALNYQVLRTADKKFSQRRPDPTKERGWTWDLKGIERVPYRLPQVLAAISVGERVYVTEGERDVHALEELGYTATTNSGGAGQWHASFKQHFHSADVTVCVDLDEPGMRHALSVYRNLQPVAASVTLMLPATGKDVRDHLAAGGTIETLIPSSELELEARLRTDPQPAVETPEPDKPPDPKLRFLQGDEFRRQLLTDITPLCGTADDNFIVPLGFTMLAGVAGVGKTTLSLHFILHLAAGLPWFGIPVFRPVRFVLIENEGPHDPFVRKVDEMCRRFKNCTCSGEPHGDLGAGFDRNCVVLAKPWGGFTFSDADASIELREAALKIDADLVTANPLGLLGMRGAGTPEETRAFKALLQHAGMGELFGLFMLHHDSKPTGPNVAGVQKVSGDWGGHPDTLLRLEPGGERTTKLVLEKVRWGTSQGRVMILKWADDPEGPVGYTLSDGPAPVSEDDMLLRIDEYLREQGEPVAVTGIVKKVTGKETRIKSALEAGVQQGRYGVTADARPRYFLKGEPGAQEEFGL